MTNASVKKDCLIVGARGFGREVLTYIEDDNPLFNIKGFLDTQKNALDGFGRVAQIIGCPFTYQPQPDEVFIAAVGDPKARFEYTATLRNVHHVDFATVAHPRANISKYVSLSHGSIIGPSVGISVDVQIGAFTHIQEYTIIGHDVKIGSWCQINGHCTIAGGAVIGDFVTIHPNSVVTSKARIGDGVTVGPGSVVIGKIPPGITIMGNPAKKFQFR